MPERFVDAIKALRHIARGNGSVMRIADRIVAAHDFIDLVVRCKVLAGDTE